VIGLVALALALVAPSARGQSGPDSSRAAVTARSAPGDSVRLPVRDRAMDVAGLLARVEGSFLYDFGTPGWPDGWSPSGLDPRSVGVELDGIPFDDPVTGAPVWELLPLAQIDPLRFRAVSTGRPDVVRADLRRSFPPRPLTEMRYRSAGGGLQAVDVTHAQRRTLGRGTRAALVFGYGGAGARGEYDGSRLRRKRRLFLGIELARGDWSVALSNLHNRNRVGAHGGVLPIPGLEYDSIYNRLLADVEDPSAVRIRIRNDLTLALAGPVGGSPLTVRAYRTNATLQHRGPADTTTARMERIGAVAEWPVRAVQIPVVLRASAFTESVRSGDAFATPPGRTFTADASIAATPALGAWTVEALAGAGSLAGDAGASGHLATSGPLGPARVHGSATLAHVPRSAAERHGFGPTFLGAPEAGSSRTLRFEGGLEVRSGVFMVGATAFARTVADPVHLLLDASGDNVTTVVGGDDVRTRGVILSLGLRDGCPRGLYLEGSGTWNPRPDADGELAAWAAESVPELHGRVRLGARALLFGGDLDLDLAVQARAWSRTAGLRLHAPTGLLALPDPGARELPGSAIVDVTVDAGVRSATVFLAVENVLSGTTLVPGNQLIPDYPYPERRFRFGVYWPIFD
jgi:hypothetical protein